MMWKKIIGKIIKVCPSLEQIFVAMYYPIKGDTIFEWRDEKLTGKIGFCFMGNFVENISPWSIKQKKIAEREEYLIFQKGIIFVLRASKKRMGMENECK